MNKLTRFLKKLKTKKVTGWDIARVVVYVIFAVFFVWVMLSCLEVVTHNLTQGYTYNPYNFFQFLIK